MTTNYSYLLHFLPSLQALVPTKASFIVDVFWADHLEDKRLLSIVSTQHISMFTGRWNGSLCYLEILQGKRTEGWICARYLLQSYSKHCIRTIGLIFVKLSTPAAYYCGYIAVTHDMGSFDTQKRMSEEGARVSNVLWCFVMPVSRMNRAGTQNILRTPCLRNC